MTLDAMAESAARRLANTTTRQSFLGRLGVGLAAVGAGAFAGQVEGAFGAVLGGCCGCGTCGYSTICSTNPNCPSGSCSCGSWFMCQCGSKYMQYRDCCAACSGGCSCGSDGRPSCLYNAPYGSCSGYTKVKCRTIFCSVYDCA